LPEINLFENVSLETFGPIPIVIGVLMVIAVILSIVIPKNSILKPFIGPILGTIVIISFIVFTQKI